MDIGQVARVTGVPASTLRFYEKMGLVRSTGRHGLRRTFEPRVVEQLAVIALGRSAGFSLAQIARMFSPDGRPKIDRELLRRKADELDRVVFRLASLRDGLRHAAACAAPDHLQCPTFRRLMKVAESGVRKGKARSPAGVAGRRVHTARAG